MVEVETKFWQSMLDQDTGAALQLMPEPSLMASSQGAMNFDHARYRKMAAQGSMVVTSITPSEFELIFPTETTAIFTYRAEQAVASG